MLLKMKTCKKIEDSDLLISLGAENHCAPNEKYNDAEFFEWKKSNSPERVRLSIRRTLAQQKRIKNIITVISILMTIEVLMAIAFINIHAKLLLMSPLLNIGVYGLICRGMVKNIPIGHRFDKFLIRHFNEFDSTEFIYKTLNNIVYSKDYDFDDKMIAKLFLGMSDPKDLRIWMML